MNEKAPSMNDGEVDHSKRNFLRGIAATAAAVVAGGGITHLVGESKEEESTPSLDVEKPYATPIENLSREEAMKEIVHDVHRVRVLEQLRDHGFAPSGEDKESVQYFFDRFSPNTPSHAEIESEIEILHQRISDLREYRDRTNPS